MGGQWSAADSHDDAKKVKGRFTGGMLHVCWRNKLNSRSVPAAVRRIVGFSYKGTVSFDEKFEMNFDTGKDPTASCPHAVFREFEVAVPYEPKTYERDLEALPFPLQLWHELFIDALSDDGLERLFCRDVNRHAEALGVPFDFSQPWQRGRDQRALQDVLTSNYIGGGLQYFVPSIVKGTSYSIRYYYRLTSPHTHATRIALLTNSHYCQNRTPFAPF
jgi:hypothetical protein